MMKSVTKYCGTLYSPNAGDWSTPWIFGFGSVLPTGVRGEVGVFGKMWECRGRRVKHVSIRIPRTFGCISQWPVEPQANRKHTFSVVSFNGEHKWWKIVILCEVWDDHNFAKTLATLMMVMIYYIGLDFRSALLSMMIMIWVSGWVVPSSNRMGHIIGYVDNFSCICSVTLPIYIKHCDTLQIYILFCWKSQNEMDPKEAYTKSKLCFWNQNRPDLGWQQ